MYGVHTYPVRTSNSAASLGCGQTCRNGLGGTRDSWNDWTKNLKLYNSFPSRVSFVEPTAVKAGEEDSKKPKARHNTFLPRRLCCGGHDKKMIFRGVVMAWALHRVCSFTPHVPNKWSSAVVLNGKAKVNGDEAQALVDQDADKAADAEVAEGAVSGMSVEDAYQEEGEEGEIDEMLLYDEANLRKAIQMAQSA